MRHPHYVGIYWGPRAETADACAARWHRLFDELRRIDPGFDAWFAKGRSRRAESPPVAVEDQEQLRALLIDGRNRTDFGGSVIESLGFSLSLWNAKKPSIAIAGTCGATVASVRNNVVVQFSASDAPLSETQRLARATLEAAANEWEPEWGGWLNNEIGSAQDPAGPHVGWLTFLRRIDSDRLPAATSAAGVSQVSSGFILQTGEPPLPIDARLITRIQREFRRHANIA